MNILFHSSYWLPITFQILLRSHTISLNPYSMCFFLWLWGWHLFFPIYTTKHITNWIKRNIVRYMVLLSGRRRQLTFELLEGAVPSGTVERCSRSWVCIMVWFAWVDNIVSIISWTFYHNKLLLKSKNTMQFSTFNFHLVRFDEKRVLKGILFCYFILPFGLCPLT